MVLQGTEDWCVIDERGRGLEIQKTLAGKAGASTERSAQGCQGTASLGKEVWWAKSARAHAASCRRVDAQGTTREIRDRDADQGALGKRFQGRFNLSSNYRYFRSHRCGSGGRRFEDGQEVGNPLLAGAAGGWLPQRKVPWRSKGAGGLLEKRGPHHRIKGQKIRG